MNCVICGKEIKESKSSKAVLCSDKCFKFFFWNMQVEVKDDPRIARINGIQYRISDEKGKRAFRGHGGCKFKIKFFDGREVITTNLWCNGEIPETHKELLPDNAEFIKDGEM